MKLKGQLDHSENVGLCVKNIKGQVLFQNTSCKKLCGDRKGKVCRDGCMALYKFEKQDCNSVGSHHFKCQTVHGSFCDVTFANDGINLVTLLTFLEKKFKEDFEFFKSFNLTSRELEIVQLVLQKRTNRQIAEALFISKSTLKTHLNNIYKKLPDPQIILSRREV